MQAKRHPEAGNLRPERPVLGNVVLRGVVQAADLALARHVELAQPTVTRSLKSLESAGLVVRGRSAGDERTVLAELTPHGHEVLKNTRRRLRNLQSAALERFPAEQRAQLITVLTGLAHAIKETSPP